MMHDVTVRFTGGKHVCEPTRTEVQPGDVVVWHGGGLLRYSFPKGSPFKEGRGPFNDGQVVTVNTKPPLKSGDIFTPEISLNGKVSPTVGDIKVT